MWTVQEYAAAPSGGVDRWGTGGGASSSRRPRCRPRHRPARLPHRTLTPVSNADDHPDTHGDGHPNADSHRDAGMRSRARGGCRTPVVAGKATIALKDKLDDAKDTFAWMWAKGSVPRRRVRRPDRDGLLDLCVYDASSTLVMTASVPPGGLCGAKPCWKTTKHGFTYANKALTPDGVNSSRSPKGCSLAKRRSRRRAKA